MGVLVTSDIVQADDGTAARVCDAALGCIARFGVTKTTLDDVAREAGVSRATVYRSVPGGRDVLLTAVLEREIATFFGALADELDRHGRLEDLLVAGVGAALRLLRDHAALRTVVALEPHLLLPQVAFHRLDPVLRAVTGFAMPYLEPHVDDAAGLAEQLVRIVLSYTLHPSDRLDPDDPDSVRRLVNDHVLPGLSVRTPSTRHEATRPEEREHND